MDIFENAITGSRVLLTGAGGSIGSSLARAVISCNPGLFLLLDNSERALYEVDANLKALRCGAKRLPLYGDIDDCDFLQELFGRHQPQLILHAAALKHVPLMETNPIAAVHTNALGTNTLATVAAASGASKLIMVSTDKAVLPRSIMGASKRVGELALLRWSSERSCMRSVRLGNVLGSGGSVLPIFERQIAAGGPVTVTHPDASRYFLTMDAAVNLILAALDVEGNAGILIPDLGEPTRIIDLAHRTIKQSGFQPEREIPIRFIGLRPGDKMAENLIADHESLEPTNDGRLFAAKSSEIFPDRFDSLMENLRMGTARRNLPLVIESLWKIVPEYRPSETILRQMNCSSVFRS